VIPLFGRVPERASGPSRSRVDDCSGLQYVLRKLISPLGFSHRREYIGGRATSGGGPAGLQALAPLHLIFGLCLASGKIRGLAFVSSNSENISYVAFPKHKNSRK
jgi:hypothetical protein